MQRQQNGITLAQRQMSSAHPIDWQALAKELSTLQGNEDGVATEIGSRSHALAAVELLLGTERIADAVDYYVTGQPGAELARSVLWLLRPWSAMLRCREIFDSGVDQRARRSAVELLRVVADGRALPWVDDFLTDADPEIQVWGILVLEQLLLANLVDRSACERTIARAQQHRNKRVRELVGRMDEQGIPFE